MQRHSDNTVNITVVHSYVQHRQWRRNEFESEAGHLRSGAKVREAPEIFLSCPSTFWL